MYQISSMNWIFLFFIMFLLLFKMMNFLKNSFLIFFFLKIKNNLMNKKMMYVK